MGRKLFLLVSLLVLIVGCQASPNLTEDDLPTLDAAVSTRITPVMVRAATQKAASPFETRTAPSSQQTPTEPAAPVKHLLNWQFVGTIPRNSQPGVLYDGNYLIWVEQFKSPKDQSIVATSLNLQLGSNRYNALRTTDGRKVSLNPGYAVLNSSYLAVQETTRAGDTELVWLLNLKTGEKKAIHKREGRFNSPEQHLPSKMEVIAGRLLWNASGENKNSCIRVFEWDMADPHDLLCAEMPGDLLEPYRSNNTLITYGLMNMQDQGAALYQRPLTLEHGLVELQSTPSAWVKIIFYQPTGLEYMTTDGQLTVWIGASAETAGARKLWATGPGGTSQVLGDPTENVAVCGGQVFWPGSGGLYAWKPGGKIEMIFQGEGELTPTCSDGWLTFAASPVDESDVPVYTYNVSGYVPNTGATPDPLPPLPFATITQAANRPDNPISPSKTPLLSTPTPTKKATSRTPLSPTLTRVTPSRTALPPTRTLVPPTQTTLPPTATMVPPTLTPLPPTPTDVPPTLTPIPPTATRRPTRTPVPPTATRIPPTAVPPTEVPPTEVPPTEVPPTEVPPTAVPPTEVPPTAVPPTEIPPTAIPPTEPPPPTEEPTQPPPATPA